MNRIKILIATVFASIALTACVGNEDTPVVPVNPITDNVDDPQEEVQISLIAGALAAVALRICHGTVDYKVFFLNILQEVDEVLMIVCSVSFVYFKCC